MEGVPDLLRVLLNNAMQAERAKYPQAREYKRTEDRKGHTNGYKPKTIRTRPGEITFAVPQVREGGFYPTALEKGMMSERALVATLAKMYVQSLSTRKVKAITEELCGVEISAMQVSRATAKLDKEIRRRTQVVGVFPNEASCLLLISVLLMEISEEWQIDKHYCVLASHSNFKDRWIFLT